MMIPISTCNAAADVLIDWFGPDDLKYIVGGHKWWQVRGLDGVDAEWITEREFLEDLDGENIPEGKLGWEEETVLRMEHLETVMVRLDSTPRDPPLTRAAVLCSRRYVFALLLPCVTLRLLASRRVLLGLDKWGYLLRMCEKRLISSPRFASLPNDPIWYLPILTSACHTELK